MKVGLLTFHNALNHGAALQAYALRETIRSFGVYCKIINYRNKYIENSYNIFSQTKKALRERNMQLVIKCCVAGLFVKLRRKKFTNFWDKYLFLEEGDPVPEKKMEYLNISFEKFVVGSDQVWNYNITGEDTTYFLDFVYGDDRKIAYAPSFGFLDIPDNLKSVYRNGIKRIRYLSARESHGVQLIKKLTGRDSELVLDPIFLLNKEKWLSFCGGPSKKGKYVFYYPIQPKQWQKFLIKTKFPIKEYKVYKLNDRGLKDLINLKMGIDLYISPPEFIEKIANAELVISGSFHCIAMSIILNIPFVAILSDDEGKNERILDILKITGLENRLFTEKMALTDVKESIDFLQVESKLKKHRKQSIGFLKKAIFSD